MKIKFINMIVQINITKNICIRTFSVCLNSVFCMFKNQRQILGDLDIVFNN